MGKKTIVAIVYDFDGTLASGNMQEHSFIPEIGERPENFWAEVKKSAKDNGMDEILSYMRLMLIKSNKNEKSIKESTFKEYGKKIILFDGVDAWFERINSYAYKRNIELEHYIISSGLREMIEGSQIANKFKRIFASSFYYDVDNIAKWPAMAVNYTTKTQFIFRISKGVLDIWDSSSLNDFTPEQKRRIPFANMIYIGDGETDIPCMRVVKSSGGNSIAVYDPKYHKTRFNKKHEKKQSKRDICKKLIEQGRANYIAEASYIEGSRLDEIIKNILQGIEVNSKLNHYK
ncbi:MAG: HAD family hydrolase [Oscillospiraceae bacterium]